VVVEFLGVHVASRLAIFSPAYAVCGNKIPPSVGQRCLGTGVSVYIIAGILVIVKEICG